MIKFTITNDIMNSLIEIEKNAFTLSTIVVPVNLSNRFRKNTKKRSSFASNKIEGNPLTYQQAETVIESTKRHLLKPEQEIRNYYKALEFLDKKLLTKSPISLKLILDTQKIICGGISKEKIGIRGPMPPGVLFAVWNDDGTPAYIPPTNSDILSLLDELIDYIATSNDHPIIKAATIHYQLVTIHPFEDGNGRVARIISSYYLSLMGFGFKNIGSLEEYMAYDVDEYYDALQMNLPVSYYDGRNNPPHPEKWFNYFIKIFKLYSSKIISSIRDEKNKDENVRFSHLSSKAKTFLSYLKKKSISVYAPIELSKKLGVSNRTIVNWSIELVKNGYLKPCIVKKRIRHYKVL